MKFKEAIKHIDEQISQMLEEIEEEKIEEIINYFFQANNIFVYGAGRSGLVGKAFAIRLVHLGFPTFVIGETITKPVKKGDLVVIDYGAKYAGYCSDITRTLAIAKVPEEAKKAYETVKEAQQEGIDMVKEGAIAKDIDLAVRDIIERHGYGKYFIHRTGHGLGLEVHEEPYISSNSETVLKEGMVFTIEPGVYIPSKFGIRIEDDIAVINKRGVTLTNAEKELLVL